MSVMSTNGGPAQPPSAAMSATQTFRIEYLLSLAPPWEGEVGVHKQVKLCAVVSSRKGHP